MTLKQLSRLSVCTGIAVMGLIGQTAHCLPLWDAAAYPTNDSLTTTNLGNMLNPEGSAWGIAGSVSGLPDVAIVNYPLTYPGLECSASNSFLFGGSGGNGYTERIAINPPITGTNPFSMSSGTIYYSFVCTIPALVGNTTGGFVCGFNNLTGGQSAQPTVVGSRLYVLKSGSGYQLGVGKQPSSPASTQTSYLPTVFSLASTNFIVASYTFVNGGASNDISQMWINPNSSVFGAVSAPAPDLVNTNGADIQTAGNNSILSFIIRQGNVQVPEIYMSDLRIGYCWACVTPPASISSTPPQKAKLNIAAVSTNMDVVTFQTNTPCFKFLSSTNLTAPSTNWAMANVDGTPLVGTNFAVTNTVSSFQTVTTNIVGGVTNRTTNVFYNPTYYQVKTYNN